MYDLLLNEDETMIAASVRAFLEAELPIERLRPGALDPVGWDHISELGWLGVGLPEDAGGSGLGLVAEALVQRECGRQLVIPTVLSTPLAAHVAYHAGNDKLATNFVSSGAPAALAIDMSPDLGGDTRNVLTASCTGSAHLLYWNETGMGLFEPGTFSLGKRVESIDESVPMNEVQVSLSAATAWIDASVAPLPRRADVLLAAALAGLAEKACDLAVEYAKIREQFGRPIGGFQAIKHRCADMAVRQRLAWYQTCLAALKLEAGAADADLQVASAKLLAAEAAHENGRACIQIHGGIGFQSECDAHWFVKRAVLYDQAGGAMQVQAERVIAQPRPDW